MTANEARALTKANKHKIAQKINGNLKSKGFRDWHVKVIEKIKKAAEVGHDSCIVKADVPPLIGSLIYKLTSDGFEALYRPLFNDIKINW